MISTGWRVQYRSANEGEARHCPDQNCTLQSTFRTKLLNSKHPGKNGFPTFVFERSGMM